VGEDFRLLFLDLIFQITYVIAKGDVNRERLSKSLEVVVNEKQPDFPDEPW
jgi:hypothetical protein